MVTPKYIYKLYVFLVTLNILFTTLCPSGVEGRTLKIRHKQGYYSKNFVESLGVMCKCCDGEGGACRSKWDASCSKLQCLPWKFRYV
ncbi:hypothetical protein PanWU01x14_181000 [Parasponia andersonii]|uniref:Transmembrane protein n=1 Tax=Parasponia andersonii TaxID=3476 RepID=A0A2P5C633_PARAD|nr:hypothetical protein PanWU01x14_181000 [Parasponia andersonii]